MGKDKACTCTEKHQSHICVLRGKGLTKQIKLLATCPNVACMICGEEANSEEHVCSSVPLFI